MNHKSSNPGYVSSIKKTLWNNMNIIATAFGTTQKDFEVSSSYENDRRHYTLQKEGKSPSPLWIWSIKISNTLFFVMRHKKVSKRYKSLTY